MAINKLKNCSGCGKLYMEVGQGMCPACYDKELEEEQVVYAYVRDHDKCGIQEIVKETGVKERTVLRMLKNGRFVASGFTITYPCQGCGTPITNGKMCDKCSNDILNQASRLSASKSVKKTDRSSTMYNANKHW